MSVDQPVMRVYSLLDVGDRLRIARYTSCITADTVIASIASEGGVGSLAQSLQGTGARPGGMGQSYAE